MNKQEIEDTCIDIMSDWHIVHKLIKSFEAEEKKQREDAWKIAKEKSDAERALIVEEHERKRKEYVARMNAPYRPSSIMIRKNMRAHNDELAGREVRY
tara:strand:- start:2427 stop:2720 length:294 start_codon:yes stop_codon:yes gene_type:complete